MDGRLFPSPDEAVDFCLSKCGDGYCPAMKGLGGYPCIQFICEFCVKPKSDDYCSFCMTDRTGVLNGKKMVL